jgi:transposase-like protein
MKYTPAEKLAAFRKVLQAIELGASVRAATRSADTVNASTFHEWVAADEEFAKQYARAAERRAEAIFEDILNIADENHKDVYTDAEGIERVDNDVVQRARLRVDARKWVLAKMQPKKYGDKLDLTSDNKALLAPVVGMIIKNELPQAEEPQNLQDDEFGDLD